jgi:hypothetical protein
MRSRDRELARDRRPGGQMGMFGVEPELGPVMEAGGLLEPEDGWRLAPDWMEAGVRP